MSLDVQSEATIDPVAVIRLVRQLLPGPGESLDRSHSSEYQSCASGEQTTGGSQEDAGCLLWDLSTLEEAAVIMMVSKSAQRLCCHVFPLASSGRSIQAVDSRI